jgi:hypothetical protein
MYGKLKNLGKNIKNSCGGIFPFLKTGTIAAFFHKLGKAFSDRPRLKINLRTGTKISE